MERGIALVESQLPEVKRVMMWSGSSSYEQHRAKLINFLQTAEHHASTRRVLLKHMGMSFEDFDKLIATLVQDGTIEVPAIKVKNEVVVILRKEAIK